MGDTKYTLFQNMTLLCLGSWLLAGMPGRIKSVSAQIHSLRKALIRQFSIVDCAVAAYGICVLLSALCSSYGRLAWTGYGGWYMGAFSQLQFVGIYFFVSRQYDGAVYAMYLGEAALFAVTILGLLHRLGIDPLRLQEGWNSGDWEYSHMLSTLGNINWLCGFYSVALAYGMVHFLREERRWILAALYVEMTAVFVLLGVQGSMGGLLILAVCVGVCIWLGRESEDVLKRIFLLLTGFFLCMPLMELLMNMRGKKAAVVVDGDVFAYAEWYVWIGGAIICLAVSGLLHRVGLFRRVLVWATVAGAAAAGFGVIVYLFVHGIDDSFGSGRGFLWRITIEGFRQAGFKDKLLGAGPDCYGAAVFARLGMGSEVWKGEHWESAIFTNAHNEVLSQLSNVGIIGAVSYLAIFFAGLYRHRGGKEWSCWLGVMAIAMYGIHGLVSFQQVLNAPLLFLALGLCEAQMRGREEREMQKGECDNEMDEIQDKNAY